MYPDLPEKPPDGARDHFSSYMHLLVCTWELEGVTAVLGEEIARRTLERSAARFYRGIYRRVLDDTARIRSVIEKHGLRIPEPR
ncbi:MAG: hypothetical protein JNL98_42435 [Bryobacterales bacterium]|nr:hypothetical protein [Bryobacterales bacterium]